MTKIPMILSSDNKTGLVFNADDYIKIRRQHRIPGKLIGIPVLHSRNQNLNGLPAFFNQYEVQLLNSLEVVQLIQKPGLAHPPEPLVVQDYQTSRQQQLSDQNAEYRRHQIETARQVLKNQSNSKKRKKKKKLATAQPDYEAILKSKIDQINSQEIADPLVQVPTEHPVIVDTTPIDDHPPLDTLEYRVYHDLWRRGNYVTTGETFGGHFLAYPGDPLHFHASHIVHVVRTPLSVQQLVSYGRVSVIVNKACVFATQSPDGAIVYQHMEWENDKDGAGV